MPPVAISDHANAFNEGDGMFIYFIPTASTPYGTSASAKPPHNALVAVALRIYNPGDEEITLDITSQSRPERLFSTPADEETIELSVDVSPGGFYRLETTLPPQHETIRIARAEVSNSGRFRIEGVVYHPNSVVIPYVAQPA